MATSATLPLPQIIQGGMGVAVSGWPLARAVAAAGQLGVVSGTGIDAVLTRRLQIGDPGGAVREALAAFPIPAIAQKILDAYFVPGGKPLDKPFKSKPLHSIKPSQAILDLTVVGNFVEVYLAKKGHNGIVGVNLLEKIQLPTLPSLFGAMLAGVDFVLMGAGIPRAIPGVLDSLAQAKTTSLRINVEGANPADEHENIFDPTPYLAPGTQLVRPKFIAIVSSATLALTLAKKASGKVDGFVIEHWSAGGHNAPPRGALTLSEGGEPVYGPRDEVDLAAFRELGLPFWLAGSYAEQGKLQEALKEGAAGIQVGTAFAFCQESGMDPEIKAQVIRSSRAGTLDIFTDPLASPTGYPFKVVQLEGTVSEQSVYEARPRVCDLGYLREAYLDEKGNIGYRCPAEPLEDFVRKGGDPARCDGRKCVCNGLFATIGLPQSRKDGTTELPIVTAGDHVRTVHRFCPPGQEHYTAEDVIQTLLETPTR